MIRSLDWSRSTEFRDTYIERCTASAPHHFEKFRTVFHTYKYEYASQREHSEALIIQNRAEMLDLLGGRWLAFNPTVAQQLGWVQSKNGLFAWEDSNGKEMVRSIWWGYGGYQREHIHHPDQVGEGWMVVASLDSLEQIRRAFGDIHRVSRIKEQLPVKKAKYCPHREIVRSDTRVVM